MLQISFQVDSMIMTGCSGTLTCTHAAWTLWPSKQSTTSTTEPEKPKSSAAPQSFFSHSVWILNETSFVTLSTSRCWFVDPAPWNVVKWAPYLKNANNLHRAPNVRGIHFPPAGRSSREKMKGADVGGWISRGLRGQLSFRCVRKTVWIPSAEVYSVSESQCAPPTHGSSAARLGSFPT